MSLPWPVSIYIFRFVSRPAITAISTSAPRPAIKRNLFKPCYANELTQNYLQGETIETIYLGGGTPSQLNQNELLLVIEKLNSVYNLSSLLEFTIETNPE